MLIILKLPEAWKPHYLWLFNPARKSQHNSVPLTWTLKHLQFAASLMTPVWELRYLNRIEKLHCQHSPTHLHCQLPRLVEKLYHLLFPSLLPCLQFPSLCCSLMPSLTRLLLHILCCLLLPSLCCPLLPSLRCPLLHNLLLPSLRCPLLPSRTRLLLPSLYSPLLPSMCCPLLPSLPSPPLPSLPCPLLPNLMTPVWTLLSLNPATLVQKLCCLLSPRPSV